MARASINLTAADIFIIIVFKVWQLAVRLAEPGVACSSRT